MITPRENSGIPSIDWMQRLHSDSEMYCRGIEAAFEDMANGDALTLAAVQSCDGPYWRGYEKALTSRAEFIRRIHTGIGRRRLSARIKGFTLEVLRRTPDYVWFGLGAALVVSALVMTLFW